MGGRSCTEYQTLAMYSLRSQAPVWSFSLQTRFCHNCVSRRAWLYRICLIRTIRPYCIVWRPLVSWECLQGQIKASQGPFQLSYQHHKTCLFVHLRNYYTWPRRRTSHSNDLSTGRRSASGLLPNPSDRSSLDWLDSVCSISTFFASSDLLATSIVGYHGSIFIAWLCYLAHCHQKEFAVLQCSLHADCRRYSLSERGSVLAVATRGTAARSYHFPFSIILSLDIWLSLWRWNFQIVNLWYDTTQ